MDNNIIYSENFKRWFGDWENNPKQSSKVVDDNGIPLVVYHGTESEFNEFKSKYIGTSGTRHGQGFYFTNDKDFANRFGNIVKAFYLNIRKPLSSDELTISYKDFYRLLDEIDKYQSSMDSDYPYGILSDYGDVDIDGRESVLKNATDLEYYSADNDVELIGSIINSSGNYDVVTNVLYNLMKYDGIIIKDDNIYIAHHPNQIKEISNKNFNNNSNNMHESKKRNVFITEKQLQLIESNLLTENNYVDTEKVLIVKNFLDKMFSRATMDGMGSDGYPKRTKIFGMKDANGDIVKNMSFQQMLDLLDDKFHYIFTEKNKRISFLKQVLTDWYNKKISAEGLLSTNIF